MSSFSDRVTQRPSASVNVQVEENSDEDSSSNYDTSKNPESTPSRPLKKLKFSTKQTKAKAITENPPTEPASAEQKDDTENPVAKKPKTELTKDDKILIEKLYVYWTRYIRHIKTNPFTIKDKNNPQLGFKPSKQSNFVGFQKLFTSAILKSDYNYPLVNSKLNSALKDSNEFKFIGDCRFSAFDTYSEEEEKKIDLLGRAKIESFTFSLNQSPQQMADGKINTNIKINFDMPPVDYSLLPTTKLKLSNFWNKQIESWQIDQEEFLTIQKTIGSISADSQFIQLDLDLGLTAQLSKDIKPHCTALNGSTDLFSLFKSIFTLSNLEDLLELFTFPHLPGNYKSEYESLIIKRNNELSANILAVDCWRRHVKTLLINIKKENFERVTNISEFKKSAEPKKILMSSHIPLVFGVPVTHKVSFYMPFSFKYQPSLRKANIDAYNKRFAMFTNVESKYKVKKILKTGKILRIYWKTNNELTHFNLKCEYQKEDMSQTFYDDLLIVYWTRNYWKIDEVFYETKIVPKQLLKSFLLKEFGNELKNLLFWGLIEIGLFFHYLEKNFEDMYKSQNKLVLTDAWGIASNRKTNFKDMENSLISSSQLRKWLKYHMFEEEFTTREEFEKDENIIIRIRPEKNSESIYLNYLKHRFELFYWPPGEQEPLIAFDEFLNEFELYGNYGFAGFRPYPSPSESRQKKCTSVKFMLEQLCRALQKDKLYFKEVSEIIQDNEDR